jgi:hypothetical protein
MGDRLESAQLVSLRSLVSWLCPDEQSACGVTLYKPVVVGSIPTAPTYAVTCMNAGFGDLCLWGLRQVMTGRR